MYFVAKKMKILNYERAGLIKINLIHHSSRMDKCIIARGEITCNDSNVIKLYILKLTLPVIRI